jgi:hypothetical protein
MRASEIFLKSDGSSEEPGPLERITSLRMVFAGISHASRVPSVVGSG